MSREEQKRVWHAAVMRCATARGLAPREGKYKSSEQLDFWEAKPLIWFVFSSRIAFIWGGEDDSKIFELTAHRPDEVTAAWLFWDAIVDGRISPKKEGNT